MDILLIILGILCLLAGLAGCILPALPGPPLAYGGMLLLHFTDRVQFGTTQLVVWLVLVVVVQVLDYFVPLLGAKYSGGSRWGDCSSCRGASSSAPFWVPSSANCWADAKRKKPSVQALAHWWASYWAQR